MAGLRHAVPHLYSKLQAMIFTVLQLIDECLVPYEACYSIAQYWLECRDERYLMHLLYRSCFLRYQVWFPRREYVAVS